MEPNKFKFLEIKDVVNIPIPRELTKEEETAILAQARMEFDSATSEQEWKDLLRQREQGLLVSGEELLKKLDAMEALNRPYHEEPE